MQSPKHHSDHLRRLARDDGMRLLNRLTTGLALGALAGVGAFGAISAATIPGSASASSAQSTGVASVSGSSSTSTSASSQIGSSQSSSGASSVSSGTAVAVSGGSH